MKYIYKKIKHSLNVYEKSLLSHFLILSKPKRILELGIDKGSTTKYIQKTLSENGIDIKYYGFDYEHVIDDLINNDQTIKELVEKNKLQFIKGSLPSTLELFLETDNEFFDFILIDATGDYQNVYGELSLLWPQLSDTGFIMCHFHKERLQYAVNYFAKKNNANYISLFREYNDSKIYSTLAVLSKPTIKFKTLNWMKYHYNLNKIPGYYRIKKIIEYFR